MPVNNYTNSFFVSSEQKLLDEIIQESIQFSGIDCFFSPRTLVAEDKLFGDDVLSAFNDAFEIEMYLESVDGFSGDADLITKFGLEIRDEIQLSVSRTRFKNITGLSKPKEGDLIFFPLNKGLFEIKFEEDEDQFYPLGTLHVYKITAQLFKYSQEDLDTGVKSIDDIEKNLENIDDASKDKFADNDAIQAESDTILDFTESNPWTDENF